ncbi:DUF6493 family protein [Agromyces badenianii]|uniref:DUF6493 family protein n=1 Tax=Agromyces badenianii TaxID=2080742 RepID=UPI000D58FE25|nr:DUF6493 family protein [Agromyces badenianii]PWC04324.1 hypothetical protein DCE94_09250 [Agromyces badenianii]
MGDLPTLASLEGLLPPSLYGLLARHAEPALEASYEFAWQRDKALLETVDTALQAAAQGELIRDASRPRWLDGLIARELREASTTYWSQERFVRVRLLERLGLVDLEADDTYILAMVSALGPGKAEKLRADPELIERALWRVFEVEGGGEVSLTNVDRFVGGDWRRTFLELAADGTLDRLRVLTVCLHALSRDFAAYRASWYSATYLAFEPTVAETAATQSDLRRLLNAAIPATVGFAVKQLIKLQKAGSLDVGETLDALPSATLVKAKGTALAALGLARSASRQYPGEASKVAQAALGHPHADVQRAAAALLTDCGDAEALVAAAENLTPSVRQELGLAAAITSPPSTAPRGQGIAPVPPPVSTADLAERAASLLEDTADVGELEAVLTALTTPGAEEVLEPLRKRATAVVVRGPRIELGDSWLPGQVARLVLDLLGDPAPPADPDLPAQRFVVQRIAELRRSAGPLLATPDLAGGWVSPAALIERLAQNPSPRHHDLIAALLRLHPDGRDDVSRSPGAIPAAVRFALDGAQPAKWLLRGRQEGPAAWWLAAARSRAPYAEPELPQLTGDIKTNTWKENGRDRRSWHARFGVTNAHTHRPADDQPTELLAQTSSQWGSGFASRYLGDWIPTLAAVWPHDAEHFLAMTCLPVLESPSWTESAHDVSRTLDALARHPGRLGALAANTLAAGLAATQRDHRLHAVDAFLDLVVTERIHVEQLADSMARYAQAWPANRWAETLASASDAPGGAEAVVDLLSVLLPQLPTDHRGLNKLLDLLRDQSIRLGLRVTDPTLHTWLGQVTGSSAAAKTARLLLG